MPELSRVLPIHLLPPVWASLLRELVCSGAVQNIPLWVQICLLTDLHMHYLGPVGSPFPRGAIWSPATFLQFSFLPINDHIMFRWQNSRYLPQKVTPGVSDFLEKFFSRKERKELSAELPASSTELSADTTSVTQKEPWKVLLHKPKITQLSPRKWDSQFPFLM